MRHIILLVVCFLISSNAFSATHYASSSGSASWANSTSRSTPCSAVTAFSNAGSSDADTVYFLDGTYNLTSQTTTIQIDNNYAVTFTSESQDNTAVIMNLANAGNGNVTGQFQILGDDVEISYITFNYYYTGINIADGGSGDNAHIHHNKFVGTDGVTSDNGGAIVIVGLCGTYGNNVIIENNEIDSDGSPPSTNAAALYLSQLSPGVIVRNNDVYGGSRGIYFKHPANDNGSANTQVYNNYFHGDRGINGLPSGVTISNNIINVSLVENALKLGEDGGGGCGGTSVGGYYITVEHNTMFGADSGSFHTYGGQTLVDVDITNNLMRDTPGYADGVGSTFVRDYNLYPSGYSSGESNSISGTPTFEGGATPTTIAGFALTAESVGYQAGSDGEDMGADVSVVGSSITAPEGDTTDPTATITSPTSNATYATSSSTINIGGTAYDETALSSVSWACPTCTPTSDTATGTTTWSETGIGLSTGENVITVTATDSSSNTGQDVLTVTYTPTGDSTPPTVTAFDIPATGSSLTVSVNTFTATDDTAVTDYLLTESATTPSTSDPDWQSSAQANYTFSSYGSKTLYAWAMDAANNISSSLSDSITLTERTFKKVGAVSIGGTIQ